MGHKRGIRHHTRLIYQENHPLAKVPVDKLRKMDEILQNKTTLSVYCDCSNITGHPIVGLGACFVGGMATRVESKKLYIQHGYKSSWAEVEAVSFALTMLPATLTLFNQQSFHTLNNVIIYSDYAHIEELETLSNNNNWLLSQTANEVLQRIKSIIYKSPELTLSIRYLGEEKKHNIYHKASHNAARKIISKL